MTVEMQTFNPAEYWQDRGKSYLHERHLKGMAYRRQEQFFVKTVLAMRPATVLELGCGFGRMTRAMAEAMPETRFLGIDVSADQIRHAEIFCCLQPNVEFLEWDLSFDGRLPGADTTVASELLLHLPPGVVESAITRALEAAPVLIHDFDVDPSGSPGRHVFNHDFPAIYRRLGLPYDIFRRDEWAAMEVRRAQ